MKVDITMRILVTGGLGFIGSAVVRSLSREHRHNVLVFDAVTYAAQPAALEDCADSALVEVEKGDVRDETAVKAAIERFKPDIIMHLAAESHVDRSIDAADAFVTTNLIGTFTMLKTARAYYESLSGDARERFRFHHISTDEVFGSLSETDPAFTETTRYDPSSPYSATKAGSDHLVAAWNRTFGLPVVTSNCSNNYGPWQHPEKLIPLMILRGAAEQPLPVYGEGSNIRDWLHVEDHAEALIAIATRAKPGTNYNVGGDAERRNIDVVKTICSALDELDPASAPRERLITYVKDRPGHDFRYAIDASAIKRDLGWVPSKTFEQGLRETVQWFLDRRETYLDGDAIERRGLSAASSAR